MGAGQGAKISPLESSGKINTFLLLSLRKMVFVYFRFEGSVADEIPDACIAIDRGALEKQSLLSAMLNPSWNSKQLGGREESPIVVSPLKSLPDWDPAMVSVIVCAQQDQPLILPLGVELEELLRMLDYFQLAPDDCGADVDLTECSLSEGIRARTFVADRKLFATALQHITQTLRSATTMETHFVCRKSVWPLSTINECSQGGLTFQDVCATTSQYGITSGINRDKHLSWSSKNYYRQEMVTELEDLGLNASWRMRSLTYFNPGEYSAMGSEKLNARMWTLSVTVTPAEPKAKRRRLNAEE